MLTIGTILYVSLLLINAVAVLSEDRFLARSVFCSFLSFTHPVISLYSWLDLNPTSELQHHLSPGLRPIWLWLRTTGCRCQSSHNKPHQCRADTHAQ